jgi:carbon storage regulator
MLVLARKVSERILIGKDIVLTVVRTSKESVRIGIEAPADVIILREELKELPPEQRPGRTAQSAQ